MNRVALREIAEFINGVAFKPEDWGETGRRIIRIQNLNDLSKHFNRTSREVDSKFEVKRGDLLVSWSASLGVYTWDFDDVALVNQHIFKVIPDDSKIDRDYLRLMLAGALVDMQQHLHGATMKHVNREEFLNTTIPLPSLEEQRRIAAILDKADALRVKRREAIVHLDTLGRSVFHEMFGDPLSDERGWNREFLSNLIFGVESGASPVCLDRPAEPGEEGLLKLSSVTSGTWLPGENKAFGEIRPDSRHLVHVGDVLFTRKNTPNLVAAVVRVDEVPGPLYMPDLIFRLRVKNAKVIDPRFLTALLQNRSQRKRIQTLATGSARSMVNISKAKLLAVELPVPPIERQREFGRRLERIEDLKKDFTAQLRTLDSLFLSLQGQTFRGEL